jgi:peptide methionine sulfoxide reductase msrA/msrB
MRVLALLAAVFAACSSTSNDAPAATSPAGEREAPPPKASDEFAYFAGGCFWGVEHYMQQLEGVVSVESGYMGGHVESPTYEDVLTHESGHLEAVRVRFDPARSSYEQVAKRFFEIHDPTQADGQGPDIGAQYLSAVFYTDDAQKKTTEDLIAKLEARGYDVVTMVKPVAKFWPAEDYHQDYYAKTGKTPYCHSRIKRFGD